MGKYKTTSVSTDDKSLVVHISVIDSDFKSSVDTLDIELPFALVPPQIAHQIASNLVMCNSYYVSDEKVSASGKE